MATEADIRLTDLIRVYDEALAPEVCEQIVDLFESDTDGQFQRARQNTWIENIMTRNPLKDWRELERLLIDNMMKYLQDYAAMPAARMLARKGPRAFEHLKIKKYRAGEPEPHHFPLHYDAFDHKTSVRILGFLWYLNTVEEGGETLFPVLDHRVPPRVGRLVVFPPMWMFEHSGEPTVGTDKYIVTSYLNFRDPEDVFRFSYPFP
jgi:hypothetical protein